MSKRGQARRHWWLERLTSAALAPLSVWLVYALASRPLADLEALAQWLQNPISATLLGLFVLTSLHHSMLGLGVIVDDYVADPDWNRRAHLMCRALLLLALLAAAAGMLHFLAAP